jgi:sugar/nucleoside kinase (ribokinase family)
MSIGRESGAGRLASVAVPHVFVVGPSSWNLLVHVAELPDPTPHTVFAEWFHEALGGTSAGKALNLRRLGLDVTLSTLVGDDATGRQILGALRAEGIDVLPGRSGNGSERHANLMDPAGRRLSIYLNLPTAPGPGSADDALLSGRRAALAAADAVVVDLADHSRPVLQSAQAMGKPVWCDLHDYDGRSAFHEEFLVAADYLFVSDERLPDPEAFLHDQVAAGKRLVVCMQGARGHRAGTGRRRRASSGRARPRRGRHQRRGRRVLLRIPPGSPARSAYGRLPGPGRRGCGGLCALPRPVARRLRRWPTRRRR